MESEDLMSVYTLTDEMQAEIIKNALEAGGIVCEIDGLHQGGFTGTLEINILVKARDEDKARSIIEAHEP